MQLYPLFHYLYINIPLQRDAIFLFVPREGGTVIYSVRVLTRDHRVRVKVIKNGAK